MVCKLSLVIHRYAVNSSTSQLLQNQDVLDAPALSSTSNQHTSDNDETNLMKQEVYKVVGMKQCN